MEFKDGAIRNMTFRGVGYYDLSLRQAAYTEGVFSMEIEVYGKGILNVMMELVLSLNYKQSIFKRPTTHCIWPNIQVSKEWACRIITI